MKKVTIKDIAKEAGVSVGTVQRALNNFGRLSPETRQKVKDIAEKLHYEPSYIAQTFATGKTYNIGVICPNLNGSIFNQILNEIETIAAKEGYVICLGESKIDLATEDKYLKLMQKRNTDGLIVVPFAGRDPKTGYSNLIKISKKTPLVIIEQNINIEKLNVIVTDNYKNIYNTVKYLYEHGRRKIGFLHWGAMPWDFAHCERITGYQDCIKELELPDLSLQISNRDFNVDKEKIKDYIKTNKPEIIIGQFDHFTMLIMRELFKLGYRIPEDIEIIGYDNLDACEFLYPSLTSISQPVNEISKKCMEILLNSINNINTLPIHEKISGKIVFRESTHPDLCPPNKNYISVDLIK